MKSIKLIILLALILICVLILFSTYSFSWDEQIKMLDNENIISLVKDNQDSPVFYASTTNAVYKTSDSGSNWRQIYAITKSNKKINKLYTDTLSGNSIYLLTQNGLFQSDKQGRDWKLIFKGSSDLENNCLSMVRVGSVILVGTEEGLFISNNQGKAWQKLSEHFSTSIIPYIITDPSKQNIIYVASEKGVFITEDSGKSWQRIYVTYGSEVPSEDYSDYDGDVSDQLVSVKCMTISNKEPNRLYIVTAKGLFFTDDKGRSWQSVTRIGLSSLNIRAMVISAEDDSLFVALENGVFVFRNGLWCKLSNGQGYNDFSDLVIIDKDNIIMAGRGGLYKINIADKITNQNKISELSESQIQNLFLGEPTIEEVQKAAIEYADVNMNKIKAWQRQSRFKALFPAFNVDYGKTIYGSSTGAMAVGPRDWDVGFSWDLADFIWSSDATSIDSRSRLTVQLRQDVLDQVTNLYFERKRIKLELSISPPATEIERISKELELQEITANLDGLTNGFFSNTHKK
jgi:photosystem II stability/assembly factor-like uncharacterized protein